jgi:AcrR family transcriptional regulator
MREKILDVAARFFVERGFNAVSMREIGEACGISKAALYYHFKAKEDLFVAILEDYLNEMDQLLAACLTADLPYQDKIRKMIMDIFSQKPEKRALIRLATQEMNNLTLESRAYFGVLYQQKFIGKITGLLKQGMDQGELKPANAELLTWILLGMMYPFFYPSPTHGDYSEAKELLLKIFFDGSLNEIKTRV